LFIYFTNLINARNRERIKIVLYNPVKNPQLDAQLILSVFRQPLRPFTESDDTRGCNNTICPPEYEQGTARNILSIIM